MINLMFFFIIDIFDLFIYKKYLDVFIANRRTSNKKSIFILITSAFIWSILNQLNNPVVNLMTIISILFILSLQYKSTTTVRLVLLSMYMGIGFITEPLGLLILKLLSYNSAEDYSYKYFIAVIFVEIIRLLVINIVCQIKSENIAVLPKDINKMLILIPSIGVINCCLIIFVAISSKSIESILLCITVILTIIASNYFLFHIFNKFNRMTNQKHEDELYIQEMKYKEAYYSQIKEQNEYVQNIKHDLKNQLLTLYDYMDNSSDLAKNRVKALFSELEHIDQEIYTGNAILNSILRIKFTLANKSHIKTEVKIQVPLEMNIDCGDLGILYGNLLDNAIEACEKIELERRYIKLESKYIEGSLLFIIKNSKSLLKNEYLKTTKKDKWEHGRGINSVVRILEKYNGTIQFEDSGEDFEVSVILYGV